MSEGFSLNSAIFNYTINENDIIFLNKKEKDVIFYYDRRLIITFILSQPSTEIIVSCPLSINN